MNKWTKINRILYLSWRCPGAFVPRAGIQNSHRILSKWKMLALVCTAWCAQPGASSTPFSWMSWHSREATVMNFIYTWVKWDRKGQTTETHWDLKPGPPDSRTLSKVTLHCLPARRGSAGKTEKAAGRSAGRCTQWEGVGFILRLLSSHCRGVSRAIHDGPIYVFKRFVHLYA